MEEETPEPTSSTQIQSIILSDSIPTSTSYLEKVSLSQFTHHTSTSSTTTEYTFSTPSILIRKDTNLNSANLGITSVTFCNQQSGSYYVNLPPNVEYWTYDINSETPSRLIWMISSTQTLPSDTLDESKFISFGSRVESSGKANGVLIQNENIDWSLLPTENN